VVLIGLVLVVNSLPSACGFTCGREKDGNLPMPAHIRFHNLTVTYGGKPALEQVSLEIPEKQIFGIIGRPIRARPRC